MITNDLGAKVYAREGGGHSRVDYLDQCVVVNNYLKTIIDVRVTDLPVIPHSKMSSMKLSYNKIEISLEIFVEKDVGILSQIDAT